MPISPLVLQRRHAELGRIRLGDKGDRGQPQKLQRFRFTSPHERHIRDLAELYGGTAQAWKNGTREEWEVYSEAKSIPVIVVRGGISQWLETWSGGGCTHRCDGVRDVLTDTECDPEDRAHQSAKPTTRLSVMLRELDAIGVWRTESHGWNAAAELPGIVELAQHVADLVPARLMLSERISIRDGKTSRFVVPSLDLEVSPARLAAIVSGEQPAGLAATPAAVSGSTAAIEAPRPDYAADAAATEDVDVVREIWRAAAQAGHLDQALAEALKARVAQLVPAAAPTVAAQSTGGSGPAEGTEPVDPDPDAVWMALVATVGGLSPAWTLAELEEAFAGWAGEPAGSASGRLLADFLAAVRAGRVGGVAA